MDWSNKLAAKIGNLNEGYTDFPDKHNPDNVKEYAEHLSREYKRLTKIVELQDRLLASVTVPTQSTGFNEIIMNTDLHNQILAEAQEEEAQKWVPDIPGYCNICLECWFDVDGCAPACTNEVF